MAHPGDDLDRLAHQLRNPVAVIRTLARLVHNRLDAGDPNRALLEAIDRECRRLDVLLEERLCFDSLQPLAVETFMAELVPIWSALADQQGLELSVVGTPAPACTDERALREVLMVLLENAFKYTPAGGRVAVCFGQDAQGTWISVADSGPGIAPTDLEQIFEPYYRGTGTEALPGRGLGLAIARDLLARLGGRIEAGSSPEGTVFTVRLPTSPLPEIQ